MSNYLSYTGTLLHSSLKIDLIILYFCLSPLEDVLNFGHGTILKYLALIIVVIWLFDTVRNNTCIRMDYSLQIPIYLILLSWLSIIWSIDQTITVSRNISYTLLPAFYIVTTQINYKIRDLESLDLFIIFGGIITLIYIVATQGYSNLLAGRLVISEDSDPNGLAARLLLSLVLSLKYFLKSNNLVLRLMYGSFTLIFIFMFFLTGSRGAFVSLLFMAIIYLLFLINKQNRKKLIYFIIICCGTSYLVYLYLPEDLFLRLFSIESYTRDLTSDVSRSAFWKNTFENVIPTMPFYGYGSGCVGIIQSQYFGEIRGMHNTYLNMLIEYGIFGLPIFIYFLIKIIKKLTNYRMIYELCAFGGILMISFFLDSYAKKYLWNALIYVTIKINSTREEDNKYAMVGYKENKRYS